MDSSNSKSCNRYWLRDPEYNFDSNEHRLVDHLWLLHEECTTIVELGMEQNSVAISCLAVLILYLAVLSHEYTQTIQTLLGLDRPSRISSGHDAEEICYTSTVAFLQCFRSERTASILVAQDRRSFARKEHPAMARLRGSAYSACKRIHRRFGRSPDTASTVSSSPLTSPHPQQD